MRDLTQHLTTRADDNHAPPVSNAPKGIPYYWYVIGMSRSGKVLRVALHRLCGSPSIPLSFILANVLPRWNTYCVCCGTDGLCPPTPSIHRLGRGLPGYLILFAPHAFEPQRQFLSSRPPSPPVFLLISTHFTATPGIPPAPPVLELYSFQCNPAVEPRVFTSDLHCRLRSLYTQ